MNSTINTLTINSCPCTAHMEPTLLKLPTQSIKPCLHGSACQNQIVNSVETQNINPEVLSLFDPIAKDSPSPMSKIKGKKVLISPN